MKIVQVCPRYQPYIGGIETHVKEISERLAGKGYEVEVVTTDPSGKLPQKDLINGVRISRFKSFAPGDSYYFTLKIGKYLSSIDKDLVHAHGYHAFPTLFAAKAVRQEEFVFSPHYHGRGHTFFRNLLHKPYKLLGVKIFSKAERVICVSNFEAQLIKQNFEVPQGKIAIIPNGLNFEEFERSKPQRKEGPTILYVGRLEEYKGVQNIVQALQSLKEYRLEIIGKGPYEIELKRLASRLKVIDRVQWLSDLSRAELLSHYKSADVFVLLSPLEAYGITVAEALASGTPCVVCNSGALQEFVEGLMCIGIEYPVSIDELKDAIQKVKHGTYQGKLLSWDEVVEQVEKLYCEW